MTTFVSSAVSSSNPSSNTLPQISHWPLSYHDLFSYIFIGLWDMQLITYSLLLITIPRIHNLACFAMTSSPGIQLKPSLILLQIISSLIITILLIFHYVFVLIFTLPYVKIFCFRDYFMLIIVDWYSSGLSLHRCHTKFLACPTIVPMFQ